MAQSKESSLPVETVFSSEDSCCLEDGMDEHLQNATKGTFKIDSAISCKFSNGRSSEEAELTPWDGGDCEDEGFDLVANSEANGWDPNEMFLKNKVDYGVRTSFEPSLAGYTVQLQKEDTPEYRNAEQKATEVANEILNNPRRRTQLESVNGEDEEDCHAAVVRGQKQQFSHGPGKYPSGNKTKTFRPTPPSTPPESLRRTTSPGGRGYASRGYHHVAPPSNQGPGGRGYYPRHYYQPNHHPQGPPYDPARGTPPPPPPAGRAYGPRPCGYHNTQQPQKAPLPPPPPPTVPHPAQRPQTLLPASPTLPPQMQPPPLPQREPRLNGVERRRHQPVADPLPSPPSESLPCSMEHEEMSPVVDGRKQQVMEQGLPVGDMPRLVQEAELTEPGEQPVENQHESCSPGPPEVRQLHPAIPPPAPYVPPLPGPAYHHPQYQQLPRPHPGQLRPYRSPRPTWRPQMPRFTPQSYVPVGHLPPQHDGYAMPPAVCNTGLPPVVQVPLIAASAEVPAAFVEQHHAKKQREMEEMKKFSQDFKLTAADQEGPKEMPPPPPPPPAAAAPSPAEPAEEVNVVAGTLHKSTLNPNAKEFVYNPESKPVVNLANDRQRPPSTPTSPGQRTPQYTPSPGVPTPVMPPYVGGQREAMFAYQNNSRATNRFRRYQGPGMQPRPAGLPVPAMHMAAAAGGQSLVPLPSTLQVQFPLPYSPQQLMPAQPYQQLVSVVTDHSGATGMLPLQPAAMGYFPDLQQHHHHHPAQQPPPPPPPPPQVLCALPAQPYQFPQQQQPQRRQQPPAPQQYHHPHEGQPPPPAMVPWIRPVLPPGMQPQIFHHHHHHHHPHHQQP